MEMDERAKVVSEALKKESGGWVDGEDVQETEEVAEETEATEDTEEVVKEEPKKEEKEEWRPKGMPKDERWEPVTLNDEQKKRFNRIYGQMQYEKRVNNELAEANRKLLERLSQIETRLEKNDEESVVNKLEDLKAKRKAALDKGEDDLVLELTDEIVELKQKAKQPKEKKEEKIVIEDKEEINQEFVQELASWVSEKDDKGEFVRPWAMEGHPHYTTAKGMAIALTEEFPNEDVTFILPELQRRMDRYLGKPKAVRTIDKVEGTEVPRSSKKQASLSPEQVRVATLLYPEMDRKTAIERYRKSLMEEE